MAFTLIQLEKLQEAIAIGALEVEYADKKVKYHSLNDMLRIMALMKQELGVASGSKRVLVSVSKGLNQGCNSFNTDCNGCIQ